MASPLNDVETPISSKGVYTKRHSHLCIFQMVQPMFLFSVAMDPSLLAAMDRDALKKQIENMKYQASMERWPLSKSIAA